MRGWARILIQKEVRDWAAERAVRDVVFLFFVHQEANERILQDWRAMHLGVADLASGWGRALPFGNSESKGDDGRGDVWRNRAKAVLAGLHEYRAAMDSLSRTYFAGHRRSSATLPMGWSFASGRWRR